MSDTVLNSLEANANSNGASLGDSMQSLPATPSPTPPGERSLTCGGPTLQSHNSVSNFRSTTPLTPSPARSRRSSDGGLEMAAKSVVLFPGSGTIAAATVGALGSVAAVATGGVALLGAGAAMCAFKFSPGLNKESSSHTKEERERILQEANKAAEVKRKEAAKVEREKKERADEALEIVLNARGNHSFR